MLDLQMTVKYFSRYQCNLSDERDSKRKGTYHKQIGIGSS